jgi:DNA invertase Pin-like site-specific DNA recombinase
MSIIYESLKETQAKRTLLSVPETTVKSDFKNIFKTKTKKSRVVGYLRVSTDKQDLDNQKYAVLNLANEKGWNNVDFVEETMSETVSYKDWKLGSPLNELKNGDVLIVAELSRLGRSILEVLEILKTSSKKGIKIYGVKENLEINGSVIEYKLLYTMLALVSDIERDLISRRVKDASTAKKTQDFKHSRPKGVRGRSKLDGKQEEIKGYLVNGLSVTALAKIYGVSWKCMKSFITKEIHKESIENAEEEAKAKAEEKAKVKAEEKAVEKAEKEVMKEKKQKRFWEFWN